VNWFVFSAGSAIFWIWFGGVLLLIRGREHRHQLADPAVIEALERDVWGFSPSAGELEAPPPPKPLPEPTVTLSDALVRLKTAHERRLMWGKADEPMELKPGVRWVVPSTNHVQLLSSSAHHGPPFVWPVSDEDRIRYPSGKVVFFPPRRRTRQ